MPHAITSHRIVSALELAKIGSSRYITVTPMTGHTAAAMADAAGGAVVAVAVSQKGSGHSAMRPATPTNNSTENNAIFPPRQPPGVFTAGPSNQRVCFPFPEDQTAEP